MKQNRILSFALAVVSFGLIFLYGSLAAYARAYVARTFRVEASLPGELLPILPGLLLAWTFQGAPLRRPRFSPANFLIYALLPLYLACGRILFHGLGALVGDHATVDFLWVWSLVRLSFSELQPLWALVAGLGLGFSFRWNPQR